MNNSNRVPSIKQPSKVQNKAQSKEVRSFTYFDPYRETVTFLVQDELALARYIHYKIDNFSCTASKPDVVRLASLLWSGSVVYIYGAECCFIPGTFLASSHEIEWEYHDDPSTLVVSIRGES